jgi:hypothetical protein
MVPSFHSVKAGLAFDICKNVKGQEYSDSSFFAKCAEIGKKIGFEWGGDWKSFPDKPHFQWSGKNREYTSNDVIAGKYPPVMPLYKEEIKVIEKPVMDNTPSKWAEEAVSKAIKTGLLKGDENGNLKLHDAVTREQLAVFLDRMGLLG